MIDLKKIINETNEALKNNPDNAQAFQIYALAKLLDFISTHNSDKKSYTANYMKDSNNYQDDPKTPYIVYQDAKSHYHKTMSDMSKKEMIESCKKFAEMLYSNSDSKEEREIFVEIFSK